MKKSYQTKTSFEYQAAEMFFIHSRNKRKYCYTDQSRVGESRRTIKEKVLRSEGKTLCGCGATDSAEDYGARGPWIDSLLCR